VHRVRVTGPAVVGLAPRPGADRAASAPTSGIEERQAIQPPPNERIEIFTLSDLGLNMTLVRRPIELRGVLESAPRPLVTLQSSARLAALLGL
jgi:hypothetical protein